MRRILLTAAAACGLSLLAFGASAQDAKGEAKEVKGVLIDKACGSKQDSEDKAAGHPKACAMKEGCAKSGYGVFSGKNFIKFDEAGDAKAKEYLAVPENATKVVVVGTVSEDGKTIAVKEIKPQGKKSEGEKGA